MSVDDPGNRFDSGNLALDLLNTREAAARGDDTFASPASLLGWLDAHRPAGDPETARTAGTGPRTLPALRTLLREAHHLRDDVALLVDSHRRGAPPPGHVVHALNRVLASSRVARSLTLTPEGPRLVERETGTEPLTMLAPVARAAVALLTDADPRRIRQCAADDCGRWFLDTSKGGRRRWCSMATCGNRAKAARYRKRATST